MVNTPVRILLADHQPLFRSGLRRLLDDDQRLQVVDEASTAEEAIEMALASQPDVVVLDVNIAGIGSFQAARRISTSCPGSRIIAISFETGVPFSADLLDAGVAGYLTKDCSFDEILEAIEVVCRGERYISAEVARQMALSMLPGNDMSLLDRLSQREMQVLMMVAQGQNTHDISDFLSLSSKTVSTYRYRLYEKLGVDNDVGLAHVALRHGVVASPESMAG